jgi:murein DD-endopeptidase MepM/ murein hydrolase activator NlpD
MVAALIVAAAVAAVGLAPVLSSPGEASVRGALAPAVALPPVLERVEVRWSPERPVQGTLFQVRVDGIGNHAGVLSGTFAGEPLHFRAGGPGERIALAAVPIDAAGDMELEVSVEATGQGRERRTFAVPVAPGGYRMEQLTVARRFAREQPEEIRRRISEESSRARAVSAASHETARMWEMPFVAPRESTVTSGFGHGRIFNEEVQSRHMGTDFRGAVGAPIRAPARGVVALVDSFYLGGGVIYIDHGAGLVTGYLHLSAHEVTEGDIVEPGQVIGRVGATGRVTGPHLHWIVRYGGITVDGMSLLALADEAQEG